MGNRIREARMTAHYTQAQLAEQLDVSIPFLSDVERGMVGISTETLLKICAALHVSADWILKGEGAQLLNTDVVRKLNGLTPEYLKIVDEIIDRLLMLIPDDEKKFPDKQ